jgi:hypothetical protein
MEAFSPFGWKGSLCHLFAEDERPARQDQGQAPPHGPSCALESGHAWLCVVLQATFLFGMAYPEP